MSTVMLTTYQVILLHWHLVLVEFLVPCSSIQLKWQKLDCKQEVNKCCISKCTIDAYMHGCLFVYKFKSILSEMWKNKHFYEGVQVNLMKKVLNTIITFWIYI